MSEFFERVLLLKQTEVFAGVSTDDLRVLAKALDEVVCLQGERLFEIRQPSDKVYFIRTGKIGISVGADPRSKDMVAILGPHQCVGEMGMFDDNPRSATAHVLEDAHLLVLDKVKFRTMMVRYPELALGLLKTLAQRLREANDRLTAGSELR